MLQKNYIFSESTRSTLSFLFYLTFFFSCLVIISEGQNCSNSNLQSTLDILFNSLGGQTWTRNYGWGTSDCYCDWWGLICKNVSCCTSTIGRDSCLIDQIQLGGNNLFGTIPTEIALLQCLTIMTLETNIISGTLPSHIGTMLQLQALEMSGTSLDTPIPTEIGLLTNLITLELANIEIEGPLPTELGHLVNIKTIEVQGSKIHSSIPVEFAHLSDLVYLDCSSNQLYGRIPSELANLLSLQMIDVHDNLLSGSFPSWIFNLTRLSIINFSGNSLIGTLPNNFGSSFENIVELSISNCGLLGSIPPSLANITSLEIIDLSFNRFNNSEFPWSILKNPLLRELNIAHNILGGTLPPFDPYNYNLNLLDISSNQFGGTIPTEISHLTSLNTLIMSNNHMEGTLPTEIGLLTNLLELQFGRNQFSGTIPTELGLITLINIINLEQNQLTGPIPTELEKLHFLELLNVQTNGLHGHISLHIFPESLRNRPFVSLEVLLSDNYFNGSLIFNQSLPTHFPPISQMIFDASNNILIGTIPDELLYLPLTSLSLAHNSLSGTIPAIPLANSTRLTLLNLENNLFSGSIPTQICLLTSLETLGLGENQINGSIPNEFGSLSFLTYLTLHDNLMVGSLPNWRPIYPLQICDITSNSFECEAFDWFPCSTQCNGGIFFEQPLLVEECVQIGQQQSPPIFIRQLVLSFYSSNQISLIATLYHGSCMDQNNFGTFIMTGEYNYYKPNGINEGTEIEIIVNILSRDFTITNIGLDSINPRCSLNQPTESFLRCQFGISIPSLLSCPITYEYFSSSTDGSGPGNLINLKSSFNPFSPHCSPRSIDVMRNDSFSYLFVSGYNCFYSHTAQFLECSPQCGDQKVVRTSECESNSTLNGCNTVTCQVQSGWDCTTPLLGYPSSCSSICGDGLIVGSEQCDDGNLKNGDFCSSTCKRENWLISLIVVIILLLLFLIGFIIARRFIPKGKSLLIIPYDEVELKDMIGEGNFGSVYKGLWRNTTVVAVKVLKNLSTITDEQYKEFIEEAEFCSSLPPHPNIVQFLGVSIPSSQQQLNSNSNDGTVGGGITNSNAMKRLSRIRRSTTEGGEVDGTTTTTTTTNLEARIISEFMLGGSLLSYVQSFQKEEELSYALILHLSKGITAGMSHLSSNNIVHRDLAARNILIGTRRKSTTSVSDEVVSIIPKISDFGMSMSVKKNTKIALRWAAPEILRDGQQASSSKSDVWSYGIVLQEITVKGEEPPYHPLKNKEIRKFVLGGNICPISSELPINFQAVMKSCWNFIPEGRPTWEKIYSLLDSEEQRYRETRQNIRRNGMENKWENEYSDNYGEEEEDDDFDQTNGIEMYGSRVDGDDNNKRKKKMRRKSKDHENQIPGPSSSSRNTINKGNLYEGHDQNQNQISINSTRYLTANNPAVSSTNSTMYSSAVDRNNMSREIEKENHRNHRKSHHKEKSKKESSSSFPSSSKQKINEISKGKENVKEKESKKERERERKSEKEKRKVNNSEFIYEGEYSNSDSDSNSESESENNNNNNATNTRTRTSSPIPSSSKNEMIYE